MWLLITAHPDDESMFFIPTLRNLINCNSSNQKDTQSDHNTNNIQLLCLSNGDYRDVSDGPIRTKETYKACSIIGIQNNNRTSAAVTVLNDDRMKDGPNEVWSSDLIANSILEHIRKAVPSMLDNSITKSDKKKHDYILSGPKDKKKMQQSWCYIGIEKSAQSSKTKDLNIVQTIDINLLTFDKGGVSNHPNHIDVSKGVQYFLNEKCIVETACKSSEQHNAKLQLYQETSNNNIAIELNVSVHTLRTISNPLHKYFLWIFVDIIPYLFIWLFQIVVYLVYFLLGGLLWGKKGSSPQIQQFSGIRSIASGEVSRQQYRIMDPILVWRAMAAHYSQFVWYRRLSVMFSRYTYINDLEKINPIFIQDDDEDEDDSIISLPPVVTIKEEESSPEFLLSSVQMNALREAILPTGLHHRPWKRIYSLITDGDSFVAFRKQLEEWHGSQGHQSSILVVKTTTGELIGGYASIPIVPLASSLGSTAGSCLFRLNTKKEDDTENIVEVHGKSYTATKKIVFDATRCMIAFGGGDDSEGVDEGFGLCLDDNFARGTTARCSAFQNEPLVSNQDGIFDVLDIEIWGFVFGSIG